MNTEAGLERCQSFINYQLQPGGKAVLPAKSLRGWRAVTISRQTGTGAHTVGELLAEYLQAQGGRDAKPWMVFDRNLVQKVLEEHDLPANLAKFMPENRISAIQDTMEELFGLHPPTWILARQTAETILHLVELGNVILIGRGATIVTYKHPQVFHVRLVGSLAKRIEHIQESDHLDKQAATKHVQDLDRAQREYVKKYYAREIDDPLLYHLMINTDVMSPANAARLIADALRLPT